MLAQLTATVLACGMLGVGSLAIACHETGIAGFGPGGVIVNKAVIDRLDREGDIQIFRLALFREFHRQYGTESLLGQPTYLGSGQQNDWRAEESDLDRMIQRVARHIRAQEAAR